MRKPLSCLIAFLAFAAGALLVFFYGR